MNLFEKEELIAKQAVELEAVTAEEVLKFAVSTFPNITFACSFGAEDVVIVDMLQKISPNTEIFYLDTDFHFDETYETIEKIKNHYKGINLRKMTPNITPEQQAELHGEELWKTDANACCNIRKVEPLTRALTKYEAWITGIRRDQAPTRANAKKIEYDTKFGLVKFNPIADWTNDQVWEYIRDNNIIYNPLHDQNYPSIGCKYCTRQVMPGEDPRAGRWAGQEKTECGLHK